MNVFVIPSWYPSESNPIYGTFVKEQFDLLARHNPSHNFGISRWGQGDEQFLLWARQPLRSFTKRIKIHQPEDHRIYANLVEYMHPAFTWSRKILKGNIKGILKANIENMERFEKEFGPAQIIHAQASYPGALIAQQLSRLKKIPYVVTIRMSPFPFDEFLTRDGKVVPLVAEPLKNANRLIATSTSLKARLNELGFTHSEVIHNPVDADFFSPGNKPDSSRYRFLAIGRLVPQKGFDLLIKAFGEVEDAELVIIGEGVERPVLEEMIDSMNLKDRIRLAGEKSREEVRDQIRDCHALVLSSRHETFGNVLVEAAACGKPVLATRCGGPTDIVNEQSGILISPNDVNALSTGMKEMMNTTWDSRIIRQHALSRFSIESFSHQTLALYERIIGSNQV